MAIDGDKYSAYGCLLQWLVQVVCLAVLASPAWGQARLNGDFEPASQVGDRKVVRQVRRRSLKQ